jgi:hypothetical protein
MEWWVIFNLDFEQSTAQQRLYFKRPTDVVQKKAGVNINPMLIFWKHSIVIQICQSSRMFNIIIPFHRYDRMSKLFFIQGSI